jgi:eukaryotic-like serine/threonine-protein kinase
MAIQAGQRLGPYEILSAIGAGGMGEVYRARDTRLDRIVAVKILPDHLSDRAELRERFEREAKTIASLNHPHICTLFDIGNQNGTDYLVMEVPVEESLKIAVQIAEALEAAHEKGIIHRDLKPANVKVTPEGWVKVWILGWRKRLLAKARRNFPKHRRSVRMEESSARPSTHHLYGFCSGLGASTVSS